MCVTNAGDRIPCPLDPNHTVPSHRLISHLKVCPRATQAAAAAACRHHVAGINAGDPCVAPHATPDAAARRAAAAALDEAGWPALTARMLAAADVVAPLQSGAVDDGAPPRAPVKNLSAYGGRAPPPSSAKHDAQNDAIVASSAASGAFGRKENENGLLIVEAGAGRGYLAAAAAAALPHAALALIDIAPGRKRADRHLRHRRLARVTADLADIDVGAIEVGWPVEKKGDDEHGATTATGDDPSRPPPPPLTHVTILGKHLCGQATDFTLRAALRVARLGGTSTHADAPPRPALAGLAVAPCCHHRLVWEHYLGRDDFMEAGFSRAEFELVAFATTWATNAHGARPPVATAEDGGESCDASAAAAEWRRKREEREVAGGAAKRLIDGCRARAVVAAGAGLAASLAPYVGQGVSPENRLLVVVPEQG